MAHTHSNFLTSLPHRNHLILSYTPPCSAVRRDGRPSQARRRRHIVTYVLKRWPCLNFQPQHNVCSVVAVVAASCFPNIVLLRSCHRSPPTGCVHFVLVFYSNNICLVLFSVLQSCDRSSLHPASVRPSGARGQHRGTSLRHQRSR